MVKSYLYVFFFEYLLGLFVEVVFAMVFKVLEMGDDGVGAGFYDVFHNFLFVVGLCFSVFDLYGAFGAVADAGAEAVTVEVADEACFVIDDLYGSFGAVGYAKSTAGTFFFVEGDEFSFWHIDPLVCF